MLPHQLSSGLTRQDTPMKADLDQGAEPMLPGEKDLLQVRALCLSECQMTLISSLTGILA